MKSALVETKLVPDCGLGLDTNQIPLIQKHQGFTYWRYKNAKISSSMELPLAFHHCRTFSMSWSSNHPWKRPKALSSLRLLLQSFMNNM